MSARTVLTWLLALLLAAFFAFVGWNKAFALLADLARYHAWTVFVSEPLGRAVGWSEIACATGLLMLGWRPGWARAAAVVLIVNQAVAAWVHLIHAQTAALPQNAVLIALLALLAALMPRLAAVPCRP
ncbi:hypothetical protein GTZ99_07590 [Novosphingobium sp. FSY-8]|uniref:DoxX-like protein n=1 Tax=Novosphingobium ovatum TaxID=1908523 RepID=A0ABW9XD13_9SPHN|nr:DoxX family protein [Novosphingobium ovatum]NBC36414.1 hypothetical protein [Novosphingobium ovatum]